MFVTSKGSNTCVILSYPTIQNLTWFPFSTRNFRYLSSCPPHSALNNLGFESSSTPNFRPISPLPQGLMSKNIGETYPPNTTLNLSQSLWARHPSLPIALIDERGSTQILIFLLPFIGKENLPLYCFT